MPIPSNKGRTVYSSGPSITQATTVASRTPTVPTQFGIPTMSMDSMFGSIDPRVSDVPEFMPGMDSFGPGDIPHFDRKKFYGEKENKEPHPFDHVEFAPKDYSRSDKNDPNDLTSSTMRNKSAHDDDMSSMSEDADDANPITPFHDVLRNHGAKYAGHTREGKRGEIRKNNYIIPNPKGGEEKIELHAHQGGPDYGNVNSITHSGDPEATAPRINNSPEKLDRNIHAQSYRGAPDRPEKMKPKDVRVNRKFLEE